MTGIFAVLVIAGAGFGLTRPVYADHTCKEKEGCVLCSSDHENGWDVCTYACGGAKCPPVKDA